MKRPTLTGRVRCSIVRMYSRPIFGMPDHHLAAAWRWSLSRALTAKLTRMHTGKSSVPDQERGNVLELRTVLCTAEGYNMIVWQSIYNSVFKW